MPAQALTWVVLTALYGVQTRPVSHAAGGRGMHLPGAPKTRSGSCPSPRERVMVLWGTGQWPSSWEWGGHSEEARGVAPPWCGGYLQPCLSYPGFLDGQASTRYQPSSGSAPGDGTACSPGPQVSKPLGLGEMMEPPRAMKLGQGPDLAFGATAARSQETPLGRLQTDNHLSHLTGPLEATEGSVIPSAQENPGRTGRGAL